MSLKDKNNIKRINTLNYRIKLTIYEFEIIKTYIQDAIENINSYLNKYDPVTTNFIDHILSNLEEFLTNMVMKDSSIINESRRLIKTLTNNYQYYIMKLILNENNKIKIIDLVQIDNFSIINRNNYLEINNLFSYFQIDINKSKYRITYHDSCKSKKIIDQINHENLTNLSYIFNTLEDNINRLKKGNDDLINIVKNSNVIKDSNAKEIILKDNENKLTLSDDFINLESDDNNTFSSTNNNQFYLNNDQYSVNLINSANKCNNTVENLNDKNKISIKIISSIDNLNQYTYEDLKEGTTESIKIVSPRENIKDRFENLKEGTSETIKIVSSRENIKERFENLKEGTSESINTVSNQVDNLNNLKIIDKEELEDLEELRHFADKDEIADLEDKNELADLEELKISSNLEELKISSNLEELKISSNLKEELKEITTHKLEDTIESINISKKGCYIRKEKKIKKKLIKN